MERGLNFAVTPRKLPVEEIVTATEEACKNLNPEKAYSLRSEVAKAVKRAPPLKSNLTLEERKALLVLKKDGEIKILPADKGKATVILDTKTYEEKLKVLLEDRKVYEVLKKDPTTTYKNRLVKILRDWRREGKISKFLYDKIYPTSEDVPKFYGLPKIHKQNAPLRPIVSSIGSITHPTAKYLASIINPLVGKNGHAIKNSEDFIKKVFYTE